MGISLIEQPRHRRSLLAGALGASLLVGCRNGFVPQQVPGPEPGGNYVALTSPIVVVSDTQEHESTGYPLLDNASAIDAYVEVSQRPPQQTLFGRRILEWALQSHPTEPFIHLGDVLDMSCRTEAERIGKVFAAANRPGAILPGNHDGLLFGIFAYDLQVSALDPGAERWNRACRRGATPGDVAHQDKQGSVHQTRLHHPVYHGTSPRRTAWRRSRAATLFRRSQCQLAQPRSRRVCVGHRGASDRWTRLCRFVHRTAPATTADAGGNAGRHCHRAGHEPSGSARQRLGHDHGTQPR